MRHTIKCPTMKLPTSNSQVLVMNFPDRSWLSVLSQLKWVFSRTKFLTFVSFFLFFFTSLSLYHLSYFLFICYLFPFFSWIAFLRKVYIVLTLQIALTAGIGALFMFVEPVNTWVKAK